MKFDMKVQFIKFQNIYHVVVVAHQARLVVGEPPCLQHMAYSAGLAGAKLGF